MQGPCSGGCSPGRTGRTKPLAEHLITYVSHWSLRCESASLTVSYKQSSEAGGSRSMLEVPVWVLLFLCLLGATLSASKTSAVLGYCSLWFFLKIELCGS